ncbi:hypothetical protein Sjap_013803 [Stephania japonica]|uniref:Uncharacterized protein n=1 Tax=Stephania japonica TaxID=461633 RepID=A0AAP0J152_9MAGN
MSAIPLKSVVVNEVTPVEDYLNEPEETLVISLHEPYIEIEQSTYEEVEKDIEVVSERLEEPQKESKEGQPLVLVKPPTLPRIFVRPYKRVEVPNELLILKAGAHAALPKYLDVSFVVDISKGEGIM